MNEKRTNIVFFDEEVIVPISFLVEWHVEKGIIDTHKGQLIEYEVMIDNSKVEIIGNRYADDINLPHEFYTMMNVYHWELIRDKLTDIWENE